MNYGWLLYRHERRGRVVYRCGLYTATNSKCCSHNFLDGGFATRFDVKAIRQRLLTYETYTRLREILLKLAESDGPSQSPAKERKSREAELAKSKRQKDTAARNLS